MGSLGVWAVAVAALLGASGSWLAEGHRSNRRSGVDTASMSRTSSQEPHSMVNIRKHTNTPFSASNPARPPAETARVDREVPTANQISVTEKNVQSHLFMNSFKMIG